MIARAAALMVAVLSALAPACLALASLSLAFSALAVLAFLAPASAALPSPRAVAPVGGATRVARTGAARVGLGWGSGARVRHDSASLVAGQSGPPGTRRCGRTGGGSDLKSRMQFPWVSF